MHLGLRARVIAVLVMVSAFTLAVAAVTLLSPLNQRLRNSAVSNFALSLRNERGALTSLHGGEIVAGGAEVTVLDPRGDVLVSTDPDRTDRFSTAAAAARSGKTERVVTGEGRRAEAEVAFPLMIHERPVIVASRKPFNDVQDATAVVRRAFTVAAAAGLAGALLVGLLLAGRLIRRLRRLRDTALRVSDIGPEAELKPDEGHDEIGDLSRAFATMQHRLREQEQARRAFVATASHELRTPLASLSVMLDMLVGDLHAQPADVRSARTQAANAEAQVQRLSLLSAELLDLSRIDAGIPLRSELVELPAVVRSVVAELDVRLEKQGRSIEVDGDATLWAVGDPGGVAQIVRVVLDNALRHTPSGGRIRVRTEMRGSMASVIVDDDGTGVAPEDRERIFERFARGTDATEGGFGLGLAIGRELARSLAPSRAGCTRRSRRARGSSPIPRRGHRPVRRTSRTRRAPGARNAPDRPTRVRPASRARAAGDRPGS